jgi:hypothetical protein
MHKTGMPSMVGGITTTPEPPIYLVIVTVPLYTVYVKFCPGWMVVEETVVVVGETVVVAVADGSDDRNTRPINDRNNINFPNRI